MEFLYIDLETRSSVDLRTHGLKRYVSSPDFEVILIAWALNDGKVSWCTPDSIPPELRRALDSKCKVVIHNSVFDVTALKWAGIADINYSRIIDTMVQAYTHALPPSLDSLSKLYNLGELGKRDGKLLINYFCKLNRKGVFNDKNEDFVKWNYFVEYACNDVVAMRELYKLMPKDNYPLGCELANYHENLRINCRGIPIDIDFVNSAVDLYKATLKDLDAAFFECAGWGISQNQKITEFLQESGLDIDDVQASTLESLLSCDDLDPILRTAIELKVMSAQVTPKKYIALQNNIYDGRVYHTLQFMGASRTGRDAGRVFQPQNLKRPSLFNSCKSDEEENAAIEKVINEVKNKEIKEDAINILSDLIRNVIKPRDTNKKIVVSDLSNIEGRTLTWLANEEWKLQFFRDFDAKKIPYDNYVMAYSKAMRVPPEDVTKSQRAIGKVMELAMGYGGGVHSFLAFAKVYNLNLSDLYRNVYAGLSGRKDKEIFHGADYGFDSSYGLSLNEYKTCQYLKIKWRESHPKIASFWGDLETSFKKAVNKPGELFTCGRVNFICEDDFLKIILPSSRKLMYYKPQVDLSFIAPCNTAARFERQTTYGGRLSENVASAVARDVLYSSLKSIREFGFDIISLVHDEIITEAPADSRFSAEKLSSFMQTQPSWALDLPLAAAGFESIRYKGK